MANLTLRASTSATNPGSTTAKGSALTYGEMDSNLILLNNEKIQLTSLSVGAEGTASGNGSIAYNNTTGVFTYTPPTASGIGAIGSVSADGSPSLGGNLDVGTRSIYTNTTNGNVTLAADGTGKIQLNSDLSISTGNITTNGANESINITANGTGSIELASAVSFNTNRLSYGTGASHGVTFDINGMVSLGYIKSFGENIHLSTTTTGTWAPNAADGPLQYVQMTGNMTVNAFTSGTGGQTVTIIFDNTGNSYTLTLGANILTPGGTGGLTAGGIDLVTITLVDDETPIYIATIVNDFQ